MAGLDPAIMRDCLERARRAPVVMSWLMAGSSPAITEPASAAADLGDEVDLAVRADLGAVGVLIDRAVDGDGHALLDLMAEARKALVQFAYQPVKIGRRHLELAHVAGEL